MPGWTQSVVLPVTRLNSSSLIHSLLDDLDNASNTAISPINRESK